MFSLAEGLQALRYKVLLDHLARGQTHFMACRALRMRRCGPKAKSSGRLNTALNSKLSPLERLESWQFNGAGWHFWRICQRFDRVDCEVASPSHCRQAPRARPPHRWGHASRSSAPRRRPSASPCAPRPTSSCATSATSRAAARATCSPSASGRSRPSSSPSTP